MNENIPIISVGYLFTVCVSKINKNVSSAEKYEWSYIWGGGYSQIPQK